MSYKPYYTNGWKSGEAGGTPITPEALNHMEAGIEAAGTHTDSTSNPHKVTAAQVGARPNTWTPTASDVGAMPKDSILLNGSENLNEIVDEGEYYYGWWTDQIANAPVDSAFHLSVRKVSAIEVSQTYTQFTGGRNIVYTRQSSGNKTSWYDWEEVSGTFDLLWENASPTSAFAEQSIWKDFSKYSAIIVVASISTQYWDEYVTAIFPRDDKMELSWIGNDAGSKFKRFVYFNEGQISFTGTFNQGAAANDRVVPYRIYGIKMGVGTL